MLLRIFLFLCLGLSTSLTFAQDGYGADAVSHTGNTYGGQPQSNSQPVSPEIQACVDAKYANYRNAYPQVPLVVMVARIALYQQQCKNEQAAAQAAAAAGSAATGNSGSANSGTQASSPPEIQACVSAKYAKLRNDNPQLPNVALVAHLALYQQQCKNEQAAREAEKQAAAQAAVSVPAANSSASTPHYSGFVPGGCGDAAQCTAYMAEAAKPKYTWGVPIPFLYGPMDAYHHIGGDDGTQYEMPPEACNAANEGKLIAMDFGTEIRAVACMGPNATMEKMIEKIKNTNVATLKPLYIAVRKPIYEWEILKQGETNAHGTRICNDMPPTCDASRLGEEHQGTKGCPLVKCVRRDGGPVKVAGN